MEDFFTVKTVADIFKVGTQTIKRWIKAGKMDGVKIGRKYRVSAESVARAIKIYSTAALTLKQFENDTPEPTKRKKAEVK